ncbi:hypothetical protein FOS14_20335 [Skermania sp. ID1734]|uniref:hypothetical protein n=1 Tax=Skermania sp. ID1734 TaxID=2597516 RepID=UPI00117C77E2|nr:hypothetical protein [Skermania sp. ID1734]TSD94656.1 hypothetical protein FOS14_20335 [Skermania sp. ID1734]
MSAEGDLTIDLVPTQLVAPRLRRIAAIAVVVGVVVALLAGAATTWPVGIVAGAVVGGPTAVAALLSMRRRTWLTGTVVRSRRLLRTRHVDLAAAQTAELTVRSGRISQISLKIGDGNRSAAVPLALYTDTGGRELEVLGLRRLADGLAAGELVAAAALSSVLVEQLRAEARGAGIDERPLYRAVRLVRDSGRASFTTLSDAEVAALLEA